MSEFELLVSELSAIRAKRETAAKTKAARPAPLRKALGELPVRFKNTADIAKIAGEFARKDAASPEGADRALREKVERASSMLKALVAGGSLTALQVSTFEAHIHRMALGLNTTEARLRAADAAR